MSPNVNTGDSLSAIVRLELSTQIYEKNIGP